MADSKEIKLSPPATFDGDRKKLNEFLIDCRTYLELNAATYNDDKKKILFMLSYMKGGTAGPWKEAWVSENISGTTPVYGTFTNFYTKVRTDFSPADKEGDALVKMRTERMTGTTADEFVERFKQWARESKITEDRPLIDYFMETLPTPLRDKILNLDKVPTTITEWYDHTKRLDNQWRRAKAIAERMRGQTSEKKKFKIKYVPPPSRYTPSAPTRDPDAMDIDRLSTREQEEHFKKGLCFICHQSRHRARDHNDRQTPFVPRPTNPQIPTYKKANDAYARIKAIYADLPNDEKEKLISEMESSGF